MPSKTGTADFARIMDSILKASAEKRDDAVRQYVRQLGNELNRTFDAISTELEALSGSGIGAGAPTQGGSKTTVVNSLDGAGFKEFTAGVATGEAVTLNRAITVINGTAYLATAANADRPCTGICTTMLGNRKIKYVTGGSCRGSAVLPLTIRGILYLSVTPGLLTDDPAESSTKLIHQEVGSFHSLLATPVSTAGLVSFSLRLGPVESFAASA